MNFTMRSLRITILYRIASEFQWHYQLVKDVNWRYWEVVLIIIFNEKNIVRARVSRRWNQRTVLNEADTFLSRESHRWSCKMKTLIRVVLTSSKLKFNVSLNDHHDEWICTFLTLNHYRSEVNRNLDWQSTTSDSDIIDIMRDKNLFFELTVYSFYDHHRTLFWANRSISFCSSKKDESI